MTTLLLALLAGCGPKEPPVAAAAASTDHEAECPSVPPTGYAVYRGEASAGREAGAAIAAAREAARARLIDAACSGVSAARCAAVERQVKPWKSGFFDAKSGYACASVAVDRATLESLRADQEAFDAGIRSLGDQVAATAGAAPVWIADPRWQTGCSAGALGSSLAGKVVNELGRHGTTVSGSGSDIVTVQLELAGGPSTLVLTASTRRAGSEATAPLTGFEFPLDLFGTAEELFGTADVVGVGACRTDEALGLSGAGRPGARGLTVRVDVGTDHGAVCEGKTVEPRVVVNRPADVHVYSVARDGRAMHVWPPPDSPARVDGVLSLGELRAVAQPDGGDERLVAVAVEAGGRFGRSQGFSGFCQVDGTFTSDLYPEGSAVATSTFAVLPADRPVPGVVCPAVPDLTTLRSTLFDPPTCH